MNYFSLLYLLIIGLTISCSTEDSKVLPDADFPVELERVLEAHGGYEQWKNTNSLSFRFVRGEKDELHYTDLISRKARIEGKGYTIGFDGAEVWVSPYKSAYSGSSARFYHNLMFYFYAMPFLLTDPGINYEIVEPRSIKGDIYNGIKVSYNEGVGDASDDEYILYYDPTTNKMEWLLYTVTYFSKEKGKSYNALHYSDWQEVNGLILPKKMTGYRTENDTISEKRYENVFSEIKADKQAFDDSMFIMPEEAEIDSLK